MNNLEQQRSVAAVACFVDVHGGAAATSPQRAAGTGDMTLVVGVDRDPGRVVAQALGRAQALGARLVLVHTTGRSSGRRVEQVLSAEVAALRARGVQADFELRPGPVASGLAAAARDHGAGRIVMGSRSRRLGRRIGRAARALGRTSPCPVVLVAS